MEFEIIQYIKQTPNVSQIKELIFPIYESQNYNQGLATNFIAILTHA